MDMKIIHKYEIALDTKPTCIVLPKKSQVLKVDYLVSQRAVCIWVEVAADLHAAKENRYFSVFKTGDGIPSGEQYIGTAIEQYLPEAYHVYEVYPKG